MPYSTLKQLEQIVEQQIAGDAFAGRITLKQLLPSAEPGPSVKHAGIITRAAAWGIFILLLAVPLLAAIAPKPNLLWGVWAVVSVWAALDSRAIGAALSSAKRPVLAGRMLVLGLAAWNLLIAICAMFLPSVPLW